MVAITTFSNISFFSVCCDLLKNIYLCGSNNNRIKILDQRVLVVICLKISIFVVAITTDVRMTNSSDSCDLLKNIYLCGSNNN